VAAEVEGGEGRIWKERERSSRGSRESSLSELGVRRGARMVLYCGAVLVVASRYLVVVVVVVVVV
jgi:hypothetical protein